MKTINLKININERVHGSANTYLLRTPGRRKQATLRFLRDSIFGTRMAKISIPTRAASVAMTTRYKTFMPPLEDWPLTSRPIAGCAGFWLALVREGKVVAIGTGKLSLGSTRYWVSNLTVGPNAESTAILQTHVKRFSDEGTTTLKMDVFRCWNRCPLHVQLYDTSPVSIVAYL